jgi:acetyl-CoA carboxylase biotin carboxylase subunit
MFESILIANRGEIAVRIARACATLGARSVAIYSEADADAPHVRAADEAHPCGPARASESYLDIARIVEIAKRAGVDAIHPGYGFLSESAEFAEAVVAAGLIFIGPTPEVIRAMGLKVAARERMVAAGVPVVPGCDEIRDVEAAHRAAAEIGYPILVKASAGGGGRGMRRVDDESELSAAIERAASEAKQAFGDGAVYLEKLLIGPRHIEIQVMADAAREVVHLFERECSIQRRHQKLVEEAPAFGMTQALRTAMGEAATRAARAVDYVGAGTCEFLLDAEGHFYFLEMNTRIQVEHPVTEAITGIDLVATQIRVASGEALGFSQSDLAITGHAIEARIYAEDPDKGFIPSPGKIEVWAAPEGNGVRVDAGFEAGQTVTPHYDPMLAKLIVHGRDRSEALERIERALEDFRIVGIRTGLPFLRRLARNSSFRRGAYDTRFIESEMSDGPDPLTSEERDLIFAALAVLSARSAHEAESKPIDRAEFDLSLPKEPSVHACVQVARNPCRVELDGREVEFDLTTESPFTATIGHAGNEKSIDFVRRKQGGYDVGLGDRVLRIKVSVSDRP